MFRSIAGNAFFSLTCDVSARLASALVLIALTRRMGESAAGVYTLSTNYTLLLSALAFWGLDQILIRDVARDRSLAARYYGHFFLVRVVISPLIWLALAVLLLWLRPYQQQTNWFIALAGGTIVGSSLWNLGQALLIAHERVWPASAISVGGAVLLVGASLAALSAGAGMQLLALILIAASLLQAALLGAMVFRSLEFRGFHLDVSFIRGQLRAGLPFVPISVFIALETQVGGILLSFFQGEAAVGQYGMANLFVTALAMLSQAVRIGIFPVMARLRHTDPAGFLRLYERSWRFLSMGSFPAVVLLIVLAEPIIRLVYGRVVPDAVLTLQCLAPTAALYFLNMPSARLIILDGRQAAMARSYAVTTTLHVLLALILVPRLAAPAVGIARSVSMSLLVLLNSAYAERRILAACPWRLIWKPAAACTFMALVVFVIVPGGSPAARAAVGLAAYGVALGLLEVL